MSTTPKFITDVIRQSQIAHTNKLTDQECDELAFEIEQWLVSKSESVEGVFDIDSDEQVEVIKVDQFKS